MRILTTILLAVALVAPASLLAQGPPPGPRAGMRMGPRMGDMDRPPVGGMFDPRMLLNRRQRLELTDDQTRQLEALAAEVRKAQDDAAAAVRPHAAKLRELWQADQPDVQAIRSELQALMTARHTAGLATASAMARAKGLLTAEQRGRVQGWADGRRMGARRFDHGARRGPGFRMQPRMRRF